MISLGDKLEQALQEERDFFNTWEPWNISERPDDVIKFAAQYGVQLDNVAQMFQSGLFFDDTFIKLFLAGSRTGKSSPIFIYSLMLTTHSIPLCFRYEVGEDTGVLRVIEDDHQRRMNIRRWGRRDKTTGEILDHNEDAKLDGTWDCGTVKGAGLFDVSKLPPRPATVWICSTNQARDDRWWPEFQQNMPDKFKDLEKGNKGFSLSENVIYIRGGGKIALKSYDQGHTKVESIDVAHAFLDEEPDDRRYFRSLVMRAKGISMHYTPLKGLTWGYEDFIAPLEQGPVPNMRLFHATAFDSPYITREVTEKRILSLKSWEIKSVILGKYAEQEGVPYYDRDKLNLWIQNMYTGGDRVALSAAWEWDTVRQLMHKQIRHHPSIDENDWTIIEEPIPKASYFLSADVAEGSEDPESYRGDYNAACVRRGTLEPDETYAPIVAYIRHRKTTQRFARDCLYAARWYNNALLCPDAAGRAGGTFAAECQGYPFYLKHSVTAFNTRKPTEKLGFQTTEKSRTEAFDFVGDWIDGQDKDPKLPWAMLLKEMAGCLHGKKGRPDHSGTTHDDCLFAFCISQWVWVTSKHQIKDNSSYSQVGHTEVVPVWQRVKPKEKRKLAFSPRGMDERRGRRFR